MVAEGLVTNGEGARSVSTDDRELVHESIKAGFEESCLIDIAATVTESWRRTTVSARTAEGLFTRGHTCQLQKQISQGRLYNLKMLPHPGKWPEHGPREIAESAASSLCLPGRVVGRSSDGLLEESLE